LTYPLWPDWPNGRSKSNSITDLSEGLSRVFATFTRALKPGGPFAFTYHHNDDVPVTDKLEQVKAALQQIYPLDLLNKLAVQTLSSLSEVDLLASMRVKEIQVTYDSDDQIP